MKNKLLLYVIAAIIWVGAGSTSGHPPAAYSSHPAPKEASKIISLQRLHESGYPIIADAATNSPSLPTHFPASEKEGSDDENETPPVNGGEIAPAIYFEIPVSRFPLPSHRIRSIPLFILLHSWRHYLSV
jgi:hypothetical protein